MQVATQRVDATDPTLGHNAVATLQSSPPAGAWYPAGNNALAVAGQLPPLLWDYFRAPERDRRFAQTLRAPQPQPRPMEMSSFLHFFTLFRTFDRRQLLLLRLVRYGFLLEHVAGIHLRTVQQFVCQQIWGRSAIPQKRTPIAPLLDFPKSSTPPPRHTCHGVARVQLGALGWISTEQPASADFKGAVEKKSHALTPHLHSTPLLLYEYKWRVLLRHCVTDFALWHRSPTGWTATCFSGFSVWSFHSGWITMARARETIVCCCKFHVASALTCQHPCRLSTIHGPQYPCIHFWYLWRWWETSASKAHERFSGVQIDSMPIMRGVSTSALAMISGCVCFADRMSPLLHDYFWQSFIFFSC